MDAYVIAEPKNFGVVTDLHRRRRLVARGVGKPPLVQRNYVVHTATMFDLETGAVNMAVCTVFDDGTEIRFLLEPGHVQFAWAVKVGEARRFGIVEGDNLMGLQLSDKWAPAAAEFALQGGLRSQ